MHGKIAIVTGASSGIGLATATRLASLGVRVAVVARREALLADVMRCPARIRFMRRSTSSSRRR